MPVKSLQTDYADAPFPDGGLARGHHQADAGKEPGEGQAEHRRAQQHGPHFVPLQRRRAQEGLSRDRFQARQARDCWQWSRRSNTIRTAARASRCCIMWTARSATSWRRSGLEVGRTVTSGPEADILVGNSLPLKNIPAGTVVHNIELKPGKGGQMARSAGAQAQLVSKEGGYALLKLPSGEIRKVLVECTATIGQVGNVEHENVSLGKAGRKRWMGKMPHNRGVTHESGGSPAWRRRRQNLRRPASGDALGPAHARLQDPQQQAHG